MDKKLMLLGAAAVGYFLFVRKAGPVFKDMQGNVISEIPCGQSVMFDVPGYNAVWLSQLQDGQLQWDDVIEIPYGPHILNCTSEPGLYQSAVYTLNDDWSKGELIGQTELRVLAPV